LVNLPGVNARECHHQRMEKEKASQSTENVLVTGGKTSSKKGGGEGHRKRKLENNRTTQNEEGIQYKQGFHGGQVGRENLLGQKAPYRGRGRPQKKKIKTGETKNGRIRTATSKQSIPPKRKVETREATASRRKRKKRGGEKKEIKEKSSVLG